MGSRIWLPAVAAVLALAFTSGDALMCYECKSVGSANDECTGEMLKSVSHAPIECRPDAMTSWYRKMQEDSTLNRISGIFDVYTNKERAQHHELHPPMACVKMNLRVDNQPVTLRTCQTAKTADVDPCKAFRDKITKSHASTTVEYCGLCETDKCNGSYTLSPIMILSIVPLMGSILMSLAYNSA